MEVGDLQKFVVMLILTAIVIGVGILVLDQFGQVVRNETYVFNETHNITLINGTFTLTNTPVSSCSAFRNDTGSVMATTSYTCFANGSVATVNLDNTSGGNPYYMDYFYWQNTSTSDVLLSGVIPAVSPIASTWMALIVTIVVLAVILTLVIRSFVLKGR